MQTEPSPSSSKPLKRLIGIALFLAVLAAGTWWAGHLNSTIPDPSF